MEHPFDQSLTANRRSWDDANRIEHLYEQAERAGEVEMAAVPSTIERPDRRRPTEATGRFRLVGVGASSGAGIADPRRIARARPTAARRRLGTLAAVCGLVGLWFGTGALTGAPSAAERPVLSVSPGRVYVVRAGDSLASIAKGIAPARDVPALVRLLARELHGGSLRPGTVLRIP